MAPCATQVGGANRSDKLRRNAELLCRLPESVQLYEKHRCHGARGTASNVLNRIGYRGTLMNTAPKREPRRSWTAPRVDRLSTDQAESGLVANGPEGLGKGS